MSKIIIKDSNKYLAIVQDIEKSIDRMSQTFSYSNKNMDYIDENNIWVGKTKDVVVDKYSNFKKNIPTVLESLNNYVRFLKDTLDKYEKLESSYRKDLDLNQDNLNVN